MAVIRFAMIHSDTGAAETGANYPGCTSQNPTACDPRTFASVEDANTYANSKGELLYVMGTAMPGTDAWSQLTAQVWKYVSDPNLLPPPTPPPIGGPSSNDLLVIGAAAVAAFLFL